MTTEEMQLHLQLYSAFRDYVKHEDDLINNRLSWNFTMQGFLFTAYAFAFQKTAELWNTFSHHRDETNPPDISILTQGFVDLHVFLLILAFVGILVGVVIFFSVHAADIAINEVDSRWRATHPEYERQGNKQDTHGNNPVGLPGLIGGGSDRAAKILGFRAARWLPWISVLAWLALALNSWYELRNLPRI